MAAFALIEKITKDCFLMFRVIILMQIVNIESTQTNKVSELIVFEGFGYIRQRQLANGIILLTVILQTALADSNSIITVQENYQSDPA